MTTPNTPDDFDREAGDGQADGCGNCGAATTDQLCRRCIDKAEKWAAEMPALVDDLERTITRQARIGSSAGHRGKGDDAPLLFNEGASEKREHVRIFVEWGRHIMAEAHPIPGQLRPTVNDLAGRVRHASLGILANLSWFRTAPEAATCLDALWTIRTTLLRAVDRPAGLDRWYAGPCGHVKSWEPLDVCELDVFARPGRAGEPPVLTCDGWRQGGAEVACGTEHNVAERRRFLLASVEDELLPLDALRAVAPTLIGRNPSRAVIYAWRKRGKLEAREVTGAGVELYRGADFLRLAKDDQLRPGRKRRDVPAEATR